MRRALIVTVALLATLLLSACEDPPAAEKPVRPVLSQVVRLQAYWQSASYAGEVKARYETALGFRIGGKMVQRLVEVGDQVAPGSLLARLDPADYHLRLLEAQAELAAAQAQRNKAAADLERYAALLKKQVVSKSEYTDYLNAFDVAKARLKQAEAGLEVSRHQTDYTELKAGRGGIVTALEAEAGQVVSAGQTVVRLALADEKEAVIAVPEHRLEALRKATDIQVRLWALPGQHYAGRVREISPGADSVTRTYQVRISLPDAGPEVRLGMTATADVRLLLARRVAHLPLSALYQQAGKPAVWLVDPSSLSVALQPVQVSQYRQDGVLISHGIEDGQRVVTAGVHQLMAGQVVRLMDGGAAL